jgi:hypothetical protein
MIKQILLILFIAFIMGACSYKPPPPPSCHGTWTSLSSEFEFEPVKIIKPLEGEDDEREGK